MIAIDDTGGNGTPILLVPGIGDSRNVYRHIVNDLKSKSYRVITMDLRGMGDSSIRWKDYSESSIALDIIEVIRQLGLESTVLVGNSISAGASVIVSATHPELVSKVVLVCPFVRNIPVSKLKLLFFRLAIARPWGASVWTGYQARNLYPSRKPSDMAAYSRSLKTMLRQKGRMRAFQKMAVSGHAKAEENLEIMNVQALVIMGSRDPDFPDPEIEANQIAEKIGAKCVMMNGAGHYPQAEYPEEFLNYMYDFIGGKNVS